MAATTIISDFFQTIDDVGETFVSNAFQGLALQINVILSLLVTISVIWYGYQILTQRTGMSAIDIASRLGVILFFAYMATNWGAFSGSLYALVQAIPEKISDTMIEAIAGASGTLDGGTEDSAQGVVKIFDAVFETALKVWDQVATSTFDVVGAVLGAIVFIAAMLFIAIAAAAIIAAKLMLFITLALAPVFIILAIYSPTRQYAEGWLSLLVNLMINQVLIYSFLAFIYQLITLAIASAQSEGIDSKLSYVAPFILVCLIGTYVLSEIPSIAGAITGGGSFSTTNSWRRVKATGETVLYRGRDAMRAGKATFSTGQATISATRRAIQRETSKNGQL